MTEKFRIQVLNHISARGLRRLPWDRFSVSADADDPHAILLRSADLHARPIPDSVLAVGRAGSGTNNIPVAAMSARGVPVFNAPGANANAVKELVLAGMLLAARNLDGALPYVDRSSADDPELETRVEAGKKTFAGYELAGHTLGVVGLGKIGCLVADAAIKLGHGRDRLRPGDHRRGGLEPAGRRSRRRTTWVRCSSTATSSRCTCRWSTPPGAMIDAGGRGPAEAGRGAAQLLPRRGGRRGGRAGGAAGGPAVPLRLRLPRPRSWSASPG